MWNIDQPDVEYETSNNFFPFRLADDLHDRDSYFTSEFNSCFAFEFIPRA